MAQTSNLREFQEAILAKLKDAASQIGGESSSRLGVTVGDKKFLINLQDVKEVLPVPPLQSVPFTKAWFLGVANVRGNLYSISDLAQFMGMPATLKSVNNRILLLSTESTEQVALLVDSLIGLRSIQAMQAQTTENASSFYSVNGFIDTEGNDWLELDVEALVQNKSFVQPTH